MQSKDESKKIKIEKSEPKHSKPHRHPYTADDSYQDEMAGRDYKT